MKGIKRILLDFLLFLAVGALFVGGYFLVLHLSLEDWNNKINTSYTFPQQEYREASCYDIDKKAHYLGNDTLITNEQTAWVYELKGLDTEEYLYLTEMTIWPTKYFLIREGTDEPILRYPVKEMMCYPITFNSDGYTARFRNKTYTLAKVDLTPAFCGGAPYDQGADDPGRFSHKKSVCLFFDLPCKLYYQCTLAKEAETGALYFLYELIDWEAELPELALGETMEHPTQTYICEVTDLLADRLPKDFWE